MMSAFLAQSVQAETISLLCKVSWYAPDGDPSYSVDKIVKLDPEERRINGERLGTWNEDRIEWGGYKTDGVFTECPSHRGYNDCSGFLNRHTGDIEDIKFNTSGTWIGYKGTCRKSKALF